MATHTSGLNVLAVLCCALTLAACQESSSGSDDADTAKETPTEPSEPTPPVTEPDTDGSETDGSGTDGGTDNGSVDSSSALFAYYTRIDSGEDWEQHQFVGDYADIRVQFADGSQLEFARASSYLPRWKTASGSAHFDMRVATQGDGSGLRWDKLNRHSHVRIIEQSDSEVLVHWRYAPVFESDENPMVPGWTGWVDEYFRIGSDAKVERRVIVHDQNQVLVSQLTLHADGSIIRSTDQQQDYVASAPDVNSTQALPTGPDQDFGARYLKLGYAGPWDRGPEEEYQPPSASWNDNWQVHAHPDVVVDFDGNASQWVFWRGLGFVPSMVSDNGAWYSNEFNESWEWPEMCESGGAEPMNDKQARYSLVRVLESSPARAVVHWRYHPHGICYNLIDTNGTVDGWGATSEFYFYFYPDGSVLSKNVLHSQQVNTYGEAPNGFEYHEAMVINSAGKNPWDNIDIRNTVTVLNMQGEQAVYDGEAGGINGIGDEPFEEPELANITRINLKDTSLDTYTIMEHGGTLEIMPYWERDFATEYPGHHFVRWDHWPVNHIRAFGRGADSAQYPSHTSLFHMAFNPPYAQTASSQTRLLLTGLSTMDNAQVVTLARSWLQAPALNATQGSVNFSYDAAQRSYHARANGQRLSARWQASSSQPVFNPALTIANWQGEVPAQITVNGELVSNAKQGVSYNHQGERTLQVFLPLQSEQPTDIVLCSGQGCASN
ncbi:hypothetical protein CHH28_02405 [Bacterioplanes sanyensis]|uniref:Secreted protein n=1 Tax=Bacterioplanes sanyensis TaxID=1249553 RepID=A0A222FG29_9GAMM|nr:hypothetical protein [Bacterioplanes sanyensis]ASP37592.1 hypothetical protein CHH28_02405 [Bacterioplanes sanyensis]